MEILISVAAKISEYTVASIGRQMGYMFSYTHNFQKLADQLEELEGTKVSIERQVNVERRNGKEIDDVVLQWLDKVDKITKEAKQLHEDPHREKVGCSKCSFPNLWQRHQLSRRAKNEVNNVAHVLGEGKKFQRDEIGFLPPLSGVGSTSATSHFVEFESRMSRMKEIMQALTDPKVSILGVYGLGGVGKSTLVDQVARKVKNEKLFDEVVKALVTRSPNHGRIQDEIADQLGLQFIEKSVLGRADWLRQRINMEKNILIILDDIWEAMKLEDIGIPYRGKIYTENREMEPQGDHIGCKVLLISRNQDVLQQMETQMDFRLEVLSEQETWCLFGFMAGDVAKEARYRDTAIKLAKKCAGLPVLIVTVARALKCKGIPIWEDALSQLARVDNKKLHEITYSALELSYNQLESNEVKALFLLCGVEGPCVAIEDLLKYIMGLGVVKHLNSLKDVRNRLHNLISALKASCLLLEDTGTKFVRMHDIIHEVAISIASRDEYIFIRKEDSELKEWPAEDVLKRCPQIILRKCSIPKLPKRLDCAKLKFLHLDSTNNRSLEIPDSIFEGVEKLLVLDLTCMKLSSLPTSLCSLTNLQTLCLRECSLGDVAGIGALKNLKILNLAKSSMKELPGEIAKLTNLIMLDLSSSRIGVIPPNIISSLTILEELYLGDTSIKWEVGHSTKQSKNASLAELKQLPNLTALDIQIQDVRILPKDLMFNKLEKYKILIGDVWKWFDEYEASKTLKLKLPTSIHLEHGIKALIERVGSLYMDEIDDISNVLCELNIEGFPLLKNLHIQNNNQIQHIINSTEGSQTFDSLPNLKTMVLQNLSKLEKLCYGPLTVNSLSKLRVIKVKSCDQMKYLFSYSLVKRLSQLISIDVSECSSMQKVVLVENDSGIGADGMTDTIEFCGLQSLNLRDLPMLDNFCSNELGTSISDPFFSTKVAFPNLATLKLTSVNLNKILDIDQLSATCGFQNLIHLIVKKCGKLKHLFSDSLIGSLSKLKQLEISECHMMEEIIDPEEGRNKAFASKEVQFPSLEKITIINMENLRTVWHCQFDGLKSMVIENCAKLVCIFPSYMQRKFNSLETLTVTYCDSVKEIFELHPNETSCEKDATKLAKLTLWGLKKLKQIWSMDPDRILDFSNLQAVNVALCDNLEYLFPYPIATRLQKIEELRVSYCDNMKEIVAYKEGQMEQTVRFVLNQLTTLSLGGLDQLRRFYAGNYTLSCPSLKKISVWECEKLVLLKRECMNSQERHHKGEPCVSFSQSLFTVETIPTNLEVVSTLNCKEASMAFQGELPRLLFRKLKSLTLSELEDEYVVDFFLQNAPSLEMLEVRNSSLKVIFRDKRFLGDDGQFRTSMRLKKLSLVQLPELKHVCEEGCQLEDLETLCVLDCSSLINLVPFFVAFVHLTTLEVSNCNGLINLITSTAARSLITLKALRISRCDLLEDIVTDKGDVAKDEIAFSSLIVLELEFLPRLCHFCSTNCSITFPLLSTVVVRECPRMEIFSMGDTNTPILHQVQVEDEEWRLEDNINGTIQKMFADKVAFRSIEHLNLNHFPELKDLWYGPPVHNVFKSLKSLVVYKCDFLSDVLFKSNLLQVLQNLEHLQVKDCDSIEAIFDVKGMDDKEVLVKQTTQMKKLTVSGLPKLKHIWNEDAQEIITFKNLHAVKVADCERLEYLFPVPLCQDLKLLEELDIRYCGVVEIVSKKEGFEECRFHFPQLAHMTLFSLSKLQSFYPGNFTLECPLLQVLFVYHCEALQMFDFSYSGFHQLHQVNKVDIPVQQVLFPFEKVCTKLKGLTLNSTDVIAIQNGQHRESLFDNIKCLRLQCFHETSAIFPIDLLQRFPNLIRLGVGCSSFHTLLPKEGVGHHHSSTSMQIEDLVLFKLEKLEYIWNEDNQSDRLAQLKSSEIDLMPSSFSFKSLIKLEVSYCKALLYLITSSMAKCLLQLRVISITECEMEFAVKINEVATEEEITFQNLEYLELNSLSSFRSFCSGKCTLIFPSLMTVKVIGCPKMKIFSPGIVSTPNLRVVEVENGTRDRNGDLNSTIKQLFADKVVHNTMQLQLDSKDVMIICSGQYPDNLFHNIKSLNLTFFEERSAFPSSFLERFINLEVLTVSCSSFETLLPWEGLEKPTKIKELRFCALSQLKYIWSHECQLDSLAQNLEVLDVGDCSSLKRLAPSTIYFHNLTALTVYQCHGMVSLVTSSTARSFVQLTNMIIKDCKMIEEIVADEVDELEDKISFNCLTYLELNNLESLKSFCSKNFTFDFPSLERVIVQNCPKMDTFCQGVLITPMVEAVETEEGDAWADNLNTTIQHLFVQTDIPEVDCEDIPELESDDSQKFDETEN